MTHPALAAPWRQAAPAPRYARGRHDHPRVTDGQALDVVTDRIAAAVTPLEPYVE